MSGGQLERTLAAIDAANADDPNTLVVRGELQPKELAHARLVSEWIERLAPDAGDALRLAGRAHHVRRWSIPRTDHPEGKAGYHRWRKALQAMHAETAKRILNEHGYDAAMTKRVGELIQKRGLGRDPEVQVLEDALCLVFLETQFAALAERFDAEKVLDITTKTLRKMSPAGIALARELALDPDQAALLERAAEHL
ncbi:MAG: DUF4202 domain-containing protein [Myxococcota bacterium]